MSLTFNFLATKADTLMLADFLFNQFAASLWVDESPTPKPEMLTSIADLSARLSTTRYPPLLFVTSPNWGDARLFTIEVNADDGRHFFAIRQRYGGPAMTWMVSRECDDDSGRFLTAGMLTVYPSYYLKSGGSDTFDRPSEMSRDFRRIGAYLRGQAMRTRFRSSRRLGPWLLPDAHRLHCDGVKLGPDSLWTIDL